jgi:transcription antitermination factor NusG
MTKQDLQHNWYAVCTRHQHEKVVARILEYKNFEIFLPLYKARRRWQDRIKELSVPLFPGYLFVQAGSERWLQILTTAGVSSIVSCGERPAAIPFSEIERVRRIVESTLRVEPHPFLKSGDWVRVKDGPIAGVEGILLRKKNIARLVLSVEMLGKSAAVEVDATHVERIPRKPLGFMSTLEPSQFRTDKPVASVSAAYAGPRLAFSGAGQPSTHSGFPSKSLRVSGTHQGSWTRCTGVRGAS